jgi:hypothetical protein
VVDNCPTVANPNQRNHDGDNRGDRCDVCPHLASAIHADNDSDGIGDDCDPRPTQAGDTVAIWEGFYDDSTVLTTWFVSAPTGSWSLASGELRYAGVGTAYIAAPGTLPRTFIQAGAVITGLSGGTSTFGVFSGDPLDNLQSYGCYLARNGSAQGLGAYSIWAGMSAAYTTVSWPGALGNQSVRFDQRLNSSNSCSISEGNTTMSDNEVVGPSISGRAGFYIDDVQGGIDFLFVVAIGS